MIRHALCASLALLALACGPGRTTFARHPDAATQFDAKSSDAKAVALAEQIRDAAGGAASWAKVKQLRWSESVEKDGVVALAGEEAWDRWEGRHYGRLKRPSGDIVVMRDLYGERASGYLAKGQHMEPLPAADNEAALKTAIERWRFDSVILCLPFLLEEPGNKLEYVGDAPTEPGQAPLEQLRLHFDPKDTSRDATTYYVSVDKQSHIIQRVEIVKPGQPDSARLAYRVSGWTTVGGLQFPGQLDNLGFKGEVIKLTDVAVADSADDTLYVPPVNF